MTGHFSLILDTYVDYIPFSFIFRTIFLYELCRNNSLVHLGIRKGARCPEGDICCISKVLCTGNKWFEEGNIICG